MYVFELVGCSMSQYQQTRLLSLSESFREKVKLAWFLSPFPSGLLIQVHPTDVSLAMGSPGRPFTSFNKFSKSAWCTLIYMSTVVLVPT